MAYGLKLLLVVSALFPGRQDKAAEPTAKDQEEARRRIRELFREDYARKAPADALALARKLLKQAGENRSDPALHFTLLKEARDKGIEGGHAQVVVEAIDACAAAFAVEVFEEKAEAFDRLKKKASPEALEDLFAAYVDVVDAAVRVDDYDAAAKLLKGAEEVAGRMDPVLANEIRIRKKEVDVLGKEWKALKKGEDVEGQLALGKFKCFLKDDFPGGLPHLEKGSDVLLKDLARLELSGPKDGPGLVALGDLWTDAAKKVDGGKYARRMQGRALSCYEEAWGKLTGLARAEFDKKLNEREERQGTVNLFRCFDPEKDARPLRENPATPYAWKFQDGVLIVPTLAGMATLDIPYQLPPDYDLEIALEFVGNRGSDLFYVFLPSSDSRCVAFQGGAEQGQHRVAETSKALEIPATQERGRWTSRTPLFLGGKPAQIRLSVRGGNLTVVAANRVILSAPGKFLPPKGKATLALGCYSAAYKVHALRLTPPGKRLR